MTTLIVIDQAPYGNWAGREALDMAFSLATFDQEVSLLFTGAGVNWLRKGQAPEAIGQKSAEKNITAAPIFGIDKIMADQVSCERYGLAQDELIAGTTITKSSHDLLASYTSIVFSN
ncbi:DsrE family protein [Marinobacter salinisoli]|uniref:DsrE family protein n=1 Tax=Marinobacter salinisoli TaxID=2769486 RepID=A0ABX7MNQ2_9GAMM|nr:DsrE family protein [Marinobacter salinisoli]QSP93788.1 DsrE family protein [Marinobacter salinisoli]